MSAPHLVQGEDLMRSILVLDDERELAELLRDVLELEGYVVLMAIHPGAVDQLLRDARPDLFLVDLMLPGQTGIEVARRLRTMTDRETPMIAMSASSSLVHEATESGLFQAALIKPFDIETLLDAVGRYLA